MGDTMKTDIIYSDETLYVFLEGVMRKKDIKTLKNKMDNIIREYQINDVIIDTKNLLNKDSLYFDIFNEYSNVIIKKV